MLKRFDSVAPSAAVSVAFLSVSVAKFGKSFRSEEKEKDQETDVGLRRASFTRGSDN